MKADHQVTTAKFEIQTFLDFGFGHQIKAADTVDAKRTHTENPVRMLSKLNDTIDILLSTQNACGTSW